MTNQRDQHWAFACPECGFGHQELGNLASDHELHCLVCHEETDRYVVLHRWMTVAGPGSQAALQRDLVGV